MPAASQRICFPLFWCRQRLPVINKQRSVSRRITKIGCKDASIRFRDWHTRGVMATWQSKQLWHRQLQWLSVESWSWRHCWVVHVKSRKNLVSRFVTIDIDEMLQPGCQLTDCPVVYSWMTWVNIAIQCSVLMSVHLSVGYISLCWRTGRSMRSNIALVCTRYLAACSVCLSVCTSTCV